jgi:hypothetical protein
MLDESTKGEGAAKEVLARRVEISSFKTQKPGPNYVKDRLKLIVTLLGSGEGVFCLTLVHAVAQPFDQNN